MWSKLFPELNEFPEAERTPLFHEAQRIAMRKHRVASGLLTGGAVIVGITVEKSFGWKPWMALACMFPVVFACHFLFRLPMRQFLWQQLAQRGKPICVHCGYNLTGNVSGMCPECGMAISS